MLANRARLKIFNALSQRPGMRVSDVARAVRLSLPATSQYLRALEACGLVEARRVRRSVVYGVNANKGGESRSLAKALMTRLRGRGAIEAAFKLATAFANPGRIEVFQRLQTKPRTVADLRASTGWSRWTLLRHLVKLESRGFVRRDLDGEKFERAMPDDPLARILGQEAAETQPRP